MNINTFFSDAYCINLDERKDRWRDVVNDLKKLKLTQINRYPAIKHRRGAVGCRLSHVDIIKRAKDSNLDNILILEDDIQVLSGTDDHISNALSELSNLDCLASQAMQSRFQPSKASPAPFCYLLTHE